MTYGEKKTKKQKKKKNTKLSPQVFSDKFCLL